MRTCSKCQRTGLTDDDFFAKRNQCKRCRYEIYKAVDKKKLYQESYRIRTYMQVRDLLKKACFRVRDEALGLRRTPLQASDQVLKEALQERFDEGMTWANFNLHWMVTFPALSKAIKEGTPKQDLVHHSQIVPRVINQAKANEK